MGGAGHSAGRSITLEKDAEPTTSMNAAFAWSLCLAAGVVVASLIPLGAARSKADFQLSDLAAPRAMFDRLPEWGKRANWAHLNSFEAFVLFAPAVLLCLIADVQSSTAVAAAWAHPALRMGYIAAYVTNVPALRSMCWAGAMVCTGILYLDGLRILLV
jgi:uncharacterized MAPEG superfamily protein